MFNFEFSAFDQSLRIEGFSEELVGSIQESIQSVFNTHYIEGALTPIKSVVQVEDTGNQLVRLLMDGNKIVEAENNQKFVDFVQSRVRLHVAENAPKHTFVHAGAVSIAGKALILPGNSYTGKTTLVLEMIKKGAKYISDEYAVLDTSARVLPFAKPISLREPGSYEQTDRDVEDFGAETVKTEVEPCTVVFSEYVKGSDWKPTKLSNGEGSMRMLEHCIPARKSPKRTLETLGLLSEKVSFYSVERQEAAEAADLIAELHREDEK